MEERRHGVISPTQLAWRARHIRTDKIEFHVIALNRIDEIIKNEDNKMFVLWMKFFTTDKREEMELLVVHPAIN